jgi:hypothetical protein
MWNITRPAARDFNENIRTIQEAAKINSIDTIISVVKCGVGAQARVDREVTNSNVNVVQPIMENAYIADGSGTPLFDSIGDLIETLSSVPDASDPTVSFLVMAITDGEENASRKWRTKLGAKITELQNSDRWTFVFRCPRGGRDTLTKLGIPPGNVLEWDQTAQGVAVASAVTASAMASYFVDRSKGMSSTTKFYADLSKVSVNEIKQTLNDISGQVRRFSVTNSDHGVDIRSFIERQNVPFQIGTVFYLLSKTETVQESKQICICDRASGAIYSGISARDLLGLPHYGAIKLTPHNLANYDVYVQSTSVNRKLVGNTVVLYCPMFAR